MKVRPYLTFYNLDTEDENDTPKTFNILRLDLINAENGGSPIQFAIPLPGEVDKDARIEIADLAVAFNGFGKALETLAEKLDARREEMLEKLHPALNAPPPSPEQAANADA